MKNPSFDLPALKRSLLYAIGWAFFHSYIQFTLLVQEEFYLHPVWFLFELIVATVASAQFTRFESSLSVWIVSIFVSILITLGYMITPTLFGIIDPMLIGILISGAIQPIVTILLLTTPVNLLGCFLGQILRSRV